MRRHEFEPARLLIGLVLIAVAVQAALEAYGEYDWPDWWPVAAVAAGFALAAVLATVTWGARRARRRVAEAVQPDEPDPVLGDMPMDDLRGEYERRLDGR